MGSRILTSDSRLLRRHGVVTGAVANLQVCGIGIIFGGGIDLDLNGRKSESASLALG